MKDKSFRIAFGDWFTKFRMWYRKRKKYSQNSRILTDWYNQWLSLTGLLSSVCNSDWKTTSEQESEYSRLRSWFIRNRSQFLPIWYQFRSLRRDSVHEGAASTSELTYKVFRESYEDPFSCFYEAFAIQELREILHSQEDDMVIVLVKLKERLDECLEWVKLR